VAKVASYHTNSPEYPPQHRSVYHDHDNCQDGKRILPQHGFWNGWDAALQGMHQARIGQALAMPLKRLGRVGAGFQVARAGIAILRATHEAGAVAARTHAGRRACRRSNNSTSAW
jgi:hypothetical protein